MKTTKISILFSLLFLAGFTMTYAQEGESNSKGGFGMKGGLTFSTIGFDYEDASTQKNRFRIGGTAGFSYEVATPGFFAFEIGTLYDLRGTKEEINLVNGNEIVQNPGDLWLPREREDSVHILPLHAAVEGSRGTRSRAAAKPVGM